VYLGGVPISKRWGAALACAAAVALPAAVGSAAGPPADGPRATATATPKRGAAFRGRTSQRRPLTFRVTPSGRAVGPVRFSVRLRCGAGRRSTGVQLTRLRVRRGRFGTPRRAPGVSLRGRFTSSRRAHGTLRVRTFDDRRRRCDSGTVRWSVRAR
jgi:hypothetical protein